MKPLTFPTLLTQANSEYQFKEDLLNYVLLYPFGRIDKFIWTIPSQSHENGISHIIIIGYIYSSSKLILSLFIKRHSNLVVLRLHAEIFSLNYYEVFEEIANNLKNLEILNPRFNTSDSTEYMCYVVILRYLKEVALYCRRKSVAPFLEKSQSVVTLKILYLLDKN